ncbi:hypothetical protein [Rhizobium leguminosarum]|uniref:hypothetical protein n=1 Tax=Rhizobium leguminosarum TaxID=384 RepID=UPI001C986141|nr:hypothetical protein [Rhizobium leguminosarum]MBY5625223.1 hypothetical protein [Rhizobium leguminosarum]
MTISLSCFADIDAINIYNECMQYNYIIGKLPVNSPECRRAPQRMPQQADCRFIKQHLGARQAWQLGRIRRERGGERDGYASAMPG